MAGIKGIISKFSNKKHELPENDSVLDINSYQSSGQTSEINKQPYGNFSDLDKEFDTPSTEILGEKEDLSELIRNANLRKISAAAHEDGFDVRTPLNDGHLLAIRIHAEGNVHTVNYSELSERLEKSLKNSPNGNFIDVVKAASINFADYNDLAIDLNKTKIVKIDEDGEERTINISSPVFAANNDSNTIILQENGTENILDIISAVAKEILGEESEPTKINSEYPEYTNELNPEIVACTATHNFRNSTLLLVVPDLATNGTIEITIPEFEVSDEADISSITEGLKIAYKITGTVPNIHNLKQAVESYAESNHITPDFEHTSAIYKSADGKYYSLNITKLFDE